MSRVFVYGTLKRGQMNHELLESTERGNAKYICRAVTPERYPLVVGTRYNIPFMLNKPGTGPYILGEMYEVDNKMLDTLDKLEDIAGGYYSREMMMFNLFQYGKAVEAYVYMLNNYPASMEKLPHTDEYKNTPEKPYVMPNERQDGPSKKLLWVDHQ